MAKRITIKARREKILDEHNNQCFLCGSKDNLVIHHRDGEKKIHAVYNPNLQERNNSIKSL